MLSISNELKTALFTSTNKNLKITWLDNPDFAPIENDRIQQGSLTITESLNADTQIKFGKCNSSQLEIMVRNLEDDVKNLEFSVEMTVEGIDEVLSLGIYRVDNAVRQTDRNWKKITAYNRMRNLQVNVIDWYKALDFNTLTQGTMLTSLLDYVGIPYESNIATNLVNGSVRVEQTISADNLIGLDVAQAILELNGVFGDVDRYGYFRVKNFGSSGIYPSLKLLPSEDLFPVNASSTDLSEIVAYKECIYADYLTAPINKVSVRTNEADVGYLASSKVDYGYDDNIYIVQDNFLVYGKHHEDLQLIAENIGSKIYGFSYRPLEVTLPAMAFVEVGDQISIETVSGESLMTYIFERNYSGIRVATDKFSAKGAEYLDDVPVSENTQIMALKSQTNELTRTVDETSSKITSLETTLENDYSTTTEMQSAITQSAKSIESNVSANYETKSNAGTQYQSLSSKISQSAHTISLGVTNKANNTQAGLTITLKDENGNTLSTGTGTINLTGLVTFNDLSTSGQTSINGANLQTGTVLADNIRANAIISNEVTAQNLKITGGSVKINGTSTSEEDYIVLKQTNNSAIETGLTPYKLFSYNNTYACALEPSGVNFNSGGVARGSIGVDGDGRFYINGSGDGIHLINNLQIRDYNIHIGYSVSQGQNIGGDIVINMEADYVFLKKFISYFVNNYANGNFGQFK